MIRYMIGAVFICCIVIGLPAWFWLIWTGLVAPFNERERQRQERGR